MSPLTCSPMMDTCPVDSRLAEWERSYDSLDACDRWILRQACVESIRLEGAEATEAAVMSRVMARASVVWDDDRRLDAEELAARLHRKPTLIARRLRSSRQGCLVMAGRWKALRAIFQAVGEWTDAQRSMAGDLLGIALDFRDLDSRLDVSDPATLIRMIDSEIRVLEALANGPLAALDRDERKAAESGVCVEHDGLMKTVRSFIARSRRQVQWCLQQIKAKHKSATAPVAQPASPSAVETPPEPTPEPSEPIEIRAEAAHDVPPAPVHLTSTDGNRRSRRAEKARRRNRS